MSSPLLRFDRSDDPASPIPVPLAVARGQRIVNRPVKFLIAAGVVVAVIGFGRSVWFVLAVPLGWIVGWCWWSYAAPQWRRWAAARGADPRALQWYAERAHLLWPKGHWGERTEFESRVARRSLQPTDPMPTDPEVIKSHEVSPGFFGPPSNWTFLWGVAYWTVAMPAGMTVLNLFRKQPTPMAEWWFLGLMNGIIFAAMAYGRQGWRQAVSPEHAFGLGMVGLLLMIAMSLRGTVPFAVLIVLGTLLLIAPTSLVVMAIVEWRRRRFGERNGG